VISASLKTKTIRLQERTATGCDERPRVFSLTEENLSQVESLACSIGQEEFSSETAGA